MDKKKWVRPLLVVLTKATDGSAILASCKGDRYSSPSGPSDSYNKCGVQVYPRKPIPPMYSCHHYTGQDYADDYYPTYYCIQGEPYCSHGPLGGICYTCPCKERAVS